MDPCAGGGAVLVAALHLGASLALGADTDVDALVAAEDALRRQRARTSPSRCSDDDAEAVEATVCATCGSAEDEPGSNDILLCDACDAGYHMRCLQPPLEAVPEGDWFCAQCAAARGGSPACAAGVRMPAGWEAVPLLWSVAFVWPKGAPFTETLNGQTGGRRALNASLGICL